MDVAVEEKEIAAEDAGITFPVLDVNDTPAVSLIDGTPVTWTVCGINSKKYREAEAWQRKEARKRGFTKLSDAEEAASEAEFIARCSLGNNGFSLNKEPLPFSTKNATIVLVRLPHVRRQVQAKMGDHEGFKKASAS